MNKFSIPFKSRSTLHSTVMYRCKMQKFFVALFNSVIGRSCCTKLKTFHVYEFEQFTKSSNTNTDTDTACFHLKFHYVDCQYQHYTYSYSYSCHSQSVPCALGDRDRVMILMTFKFLNLVKLLIASIINYNPQLVILNQAITIVLSMIRVDYYYFIIN